MDQLIAGAVNILSVIYAQIYFPTYSNGLKEIAQYLGFQWSESGASGLKSLIWRSEWELSKDASLKQKLITYNAEDCEALARVTDSIAQLCERQAGAVGSQDGDAVHVDSLKRLDLQRFGNKEFSMPELKHINQAAYWDYQRERIYVRSSKRLKRVSRMSAKGRTKALPINKVIEYPPPNYCPRCQASTIRKQNTMSKVVRDLKFGRVSVKRWVVKYLYYRFVCCRCGAIFSTRPGHLTGHKIGPNVIAYMIYQLIELLLPNESVARSLKQLFGLNLKQVDIHREKSRASQRYEETYQKIISKIVTGRLLHADETKASIKGKSAYVWVFTNLEEVAFYYTETREGDFLQELLRNFHGVLVSDFYAAYDSIDCPQQKCLIHLMRDLNDDLLKYPFNEELKELVREFAMLLKPVIETVDRFGLKAHFLRKHKVFVERFFRRLSKRDYQSEIAIKYKKRFDKNRDKLFTFLDYDGVPWNNNNAEHAVKAFARLRQGVRGSSTEKGIREYLTFLSISETCKYKGVSFLEFLRSGGKTLMNSPTPHHRTSHQRATKCALQG